MTLKIELTRADPLKIGTDALAVSANNDLILGGGLLGQIAREGGATIQQQCNKIGTVPLGEVAVTGAGELKFKHLFHAAVQPLGLWSDAKSVRMATRKCLRKTAELGLASLALTTLGTGAGGLSVDPCAQVMFDEILAFAKDPGPVARIVILLDDDRVHDAFFWPYEKRVPAEMKGGAPPPPPPPPLPIPGEGAPRT